MMLTADKDARHDRLGEAPGEGTGFYPVDGTGATPIKAFDFASNIESASHPGSADY